jgi:hypothetical protein
MYLPPDHNDIPRRQTGPRSDPAQNGQPQSARHRRGNVTPEPVRSLFFKLPLCHPPSALVSPVNFVSVTSIYQQTDHYIYVDKKKIRWRPGPANGNTRQSSLERFLEQHLEQLFGTSCNTHRNSPQQNAAKVAKFRLIVFCVASAFRFFLLLFFVPKIGGLPPQTFFQYSF